MPETVLLKFRDKTLVAESLKRIFGKSSGGEFTFKVIIRGDKLANELDPAGGRVKVVVGKKELGLAEVSATTKIQVGMLEDEELKNYVGNKSITGVLGDLLDNDKRQATISSVISLVELFYTKG